MDRPLPINADLEFAFLAALIWLGDVGLARQLRGDVPGDVFTRAEHHAAWNIIGRLVDVDTLDSVSFLTACTQNLDAGEAFAATALAWDGTATKNGIRHWAAQLKGLAHRRAKIRQLHSLWADVYDLNVGTEELERRDVEAHQQNIAKYNPDVPNSMSDACERFDAYVGNLHGEHSKALTTGIPEIDARMLMLPEYWLIAARTSVGKTALILSMMVHQLFDGKRVLFASMEQERELVVAKMVSLITGLSSRQVLGLEPKTQQQFDDVQFVRDSLPKLPLHLLDGSRTVENVWSHAAQIQERHGLDVVYIDQLDKFVFDSRERSLERQMAAVSQSLFAMRKALSVPVVLLAQLNIKQGTENPIPCESQIRDCSQVLQDADKVWILDRPAAEPERFAKIEKKRQDLLAAGDPSHEYNDFRDGAALIKQRKDRNATGGGTWEQRVSFDATCGRFGPRADAAYTDTEF